MGHPSDAMLGELAAGRAARGAAEQQRAHLDGCLACLSRFTALQAALTTRAQHRAEPSRPAATVSQLRAAVQETISEAHRESDRFRSLHKLTAEVQRPHTPSGPIPAASLSLVDRGDTQASADEDDPLLARLDQLAEEATARLKDIWALRALVKKLRRLRRQVRKADLPTYRKAELRAALSEAEERLSVALSGSPR